MGRNFLNGWGGEPVTPDQKTCEVLLIVNEAGRSISYKYAAELIDILNKKEVEG